MRYWLLPTVFIVATSAGAQEPVRLFAAGSLRAVMTELGAAFGGQPLQATYGPSGVLRDRLARGEEADVFASANMEHPASLEKAGRAGAVARFARNQLCALTRDDVALETGSVLDRLLDPAVKLGTSTPKADPSGDYAWQLFDKAEQLRPGARATLERKALKLTGGPDSPSPPKDRSLYGMLVAERKADVFLTYCTNAVAARAENSSLRVAALPAELAVGADYGITVVSGARPAARRFVDFVLSPRGQEVLARHGFGTGR
jgi:ABC-type molybdate transport system substrate-binding protein